MPKRIQMTPWRNITAKLRVSASKPTTLEAFKEAALEEPGALPDGFGQYDGLPTAYKHLKVSADASALKMAYTNWCRYLRNQKELVCIPTTTNTETRLTFEPLKEYEQISMRDDPRKYRLKFERRAATIARTSTFNAEDAAELDEIRNTLIRVIEEEDKKLKLKYDKRIRN